MSITKLKEKIEKIEQLKQAEFEKIEQLKRQQQAVKQRVRNIQSTEQRKADIKLKILLGCYLIKSMKNNPSLAQQHRSRITEYFASEKNERIRAKNIEMLDDLFNSFEDKSDD